MIKVDANGHRHVTDPKLGPKAWAESDIVNWRVSGLVVDAIAGAFGGGIFKGAVLTGIGWALFGVFAGAPYALGTAPRRGPAGSRAWDRSWCPEAPCCSRGPKGRSRRNHRDARDCQRQAARPAV
jgi:hypothetical protein